MSTSKLCVCLYLVWAAIAGAMLLSSHGGIAGDFDRHLLDSDDPHSRNIHAQTLLFNRWKVGFESEPSIYKWFVIVQTPANIAARLIFRLLTLIHPFDSPFPYGLSYPSYIMLFLLLLGVLQWYALGLFIGMVWKKIGQRERSV